ncbi:MAG: N-acetylmuramoyl-L-alanine amidase, partial [Kiritimatiellia bacterium]
LAGHPHIGTATQFALAIQRSFLALPDPPMDRGIRHAHFKVLRDVPAPALLIETGFLTNVDDFARLTHPDTRKMLARAIADGIAPITP